MNDTVGTEELERLLDTAEHGADSFTAQEADMDLADMARRLAAEVLAGRERDIAMRKALRDLKWASKDLWVDGKLRHVPMTAGEMAQLARAALAAMGKEALNE